MIVKLRELDNFMDGTSNRRLKLFFRDINGIEN